MSFHKGNALPCPVSEDSGETLRLEGGILSRTDGNCNHKNHMRSRNQKNLSIRSFPSLRLSRSI